MSDSLILAIGCGAVLCLAVILFLFLRPTMPKWISLKQLFQSHKLVRLWVRYNIEAQYADAALGILWVVLEPLTKTLVYTVAFSSFLGLRRPRGDIPFISFFLTGIILWQLFAEGVATGAIVVIKNLSLMNQINFSREILVITRMGEMLIDFSIGFLLMLIINAINHIFPTWQYVYLPLIVLSLCMFTLGIMFIVSYISVFVRDVPPVINSALRMLFYLTPVLYPISTVPEKLQFVALLNPIALLIDSYRNIILYHQLPHVSHVIYSLFVSAVTLIIGYTFFKANERLMVDFQ